MKIWLLKDGENLPIQQNVSKMRTWMLADELIQRGHDVTWWSSTHSHQQKSLLAASDLDTVIDSGLRLRLLNCGSYTKNRSLARYLHHRKLARRFLREAKAESPPDLIVASFPTIDFATAGTVAASRLNCRSVVDIRDPWPDVAYNLYRGWKRSGVKLLLSGMNRRAKRCLAGADALVACSGGFLDWGLRKADRSRRSSDRVFYIGRPTESPPENSSSPDWLNEIGDDKYVVSFVGAFGQVYELELVCQVASKLAASGDKRFHFVLAGDGDKGANIRALSANLPNVSTPGWIPLDEAKALLHRSILGLAPYRQLRGCMPNKVFEYLALGLPVISSLEGDLAELLSEYNAGYSYAPGDSSGLLDCLHMALECSQDTERLSAGALRLFRQKFTAADIYENYATHLEQLVDAA